MSCVNGKYISGYLYRAFQEQSAKVWKVILDIRINQLIFHKKIHRQINQYNKERGKIDK